ncbi:hypothetical protein D3C72_573170 [compost metagenome]
MLIVYSDRGFQYHVLRLPRMLPQVGAQISMSRGGSFYDNASMKSFLHLKMEELYPYDIRSLEEAQRRIEEYIFIFTTRADRRNTKEADDVEYRRQLALSVFLMSTKTGSLPISLFDITNILNRITRSFEVFFA